MGFPILLLFIFLVIGLSLEGAGDGVKEYIGIWDMSVLRTRGAVWTEAVSQIFFSIGITFGVMTAFGSHCPRSEPALLNSFVVALSNSMFSIIAGFAVFGALGHLSFVEQTPINKLNFGGFGLVFGAWPVALNTVAGGVNWVRLLFVMLFLLGIDSAFSLLEAGLTICKDTLTRNIGKGKKKTVAAVACFVAWGFSLIYATDAGLFFLDVVDYYINFIMLFVGILETFAVGWIYNIEGQIDSFGYDTILAYLLTNFGSVTVASCIWFGGNTDNYVWIGFIALILVYLAGMAFVMYKLMAIKATNPDRWPTKMSIVMDLAFGNVYLLKEQMEGTIGPVPKIWCILVKQFIPHILIILFVNGASAENGVNGESKFWNYEGYVHWPFQTLGLLAFIFACLIFLIGVVAPETYSILIDIEKEEEMRESMRSSYMLKASSHVSGKEVDEEAQAPEVAPDGEN